MEVGTQISELDCVGGDEEHMEELISCFRRGGEPHHRTESSDVRVTAIVIPCSIRLLPLWKNWCQYQLVFHVA